MLECAHLEIGFGLHWRRLCQPANCPELSDPAADLRGTLPPVKAAHLAATTEPRRLAQLLRAMEGYEGPLPVRCALRLAPLVFVRPGELRHAQWAHIGLETGEWRFTISKTGTPHIVPLSKQAIAILRELNPSGETSRRAASALRRADVASLSP